MDYTNQHGLIVIFLSTDRGPAEKRRVRPAGLELREKALSPSRRRFRAHPSTGSHMAIPAALQLSPIHRPVGNARVQKGRRFKGFMKLIPSFLNPWNLLHFFLLIPRPASGCCDPASPSFRSVCGANPRAYQPNRHCRLH
jgi:hypothetical protein